MTTLTNVNLFLRCAVQDVVKKIADKEKRMDVCVAAAGLLAGADCLEYPAKDFQKIMDVNVNGVLYTAQAAGRQMSQGGSILLIASMSGSITNKVSERDSLPSYACRDLILLSRIMLGSRIIRANPP